jgi:hypothetical protein
MTHVRIRIGETRSDLTTGQNSRRAQRRVHDLAALALAAVFLIAGCGGSANEGQPAAAGGNGALAGAGGEHSSGGSTSLGGSPDTGAAGSSGASTSLGGSPDAGAADSSGGSTGLGGSPDAGAAGSSGGSTSLGGSPNAGTGGLGELDASIDETVVCRPEKQVSTAAEIVAEVVALGEQWAIGRLDRNSGFVITDDLRAAVDITLDPKAIPVPGCQDAGVACTASFGGGDVAGVVPDGQGQVIIQAGSAIRLRPYLHDMHPASPPVVPIVQILPPCTEPCGLDERRCPTDTVCYPVGERFCLCCGLNQPKFCACESPQVVDFPQMTAADQCDYRLSPDTGFVGTCQNGECVVG